MSKPKKFLVGGKAVYVNRDRCRSIERSQYIGPNNYRFYEKVGKKYIPIGILIDEESFRYIVQHVFHFQYNRRTNRVAVEKALLKYAMKLDQQTLDLIKINLRLDPEREERYSTIYSCPIPRRLDRWPYV
jgi:hypothetical protein